LSQKVGSVAPSKFSVNESLDFERLPIQREKQRSMDSAADDLPKFNIKVSREARKEANRGQTMSEREEVYPSHMNRDDLQAILSSKA
jgi:hypothetical protein